MKKQIDSKKIYFSIKNGFLLALACIFSPFSLSEVTLDGSMGTTGSLVGPDYQITEDLGQRTGGNLFHSFGQFNINSAESATFSGSADIKNVISRVTGGQTSTIDGAFRSTIPGANVYFLNPSGVIFGENASLDVQGSFHASTADYLKFKDGVKFETGLAKANPILTTASPEAFGFLNNTPASISVSGGNNKVLKVPEDETLSLIGGDLNIEDRSLYAPSGQIILASAGSTGEVVMNESGIGTSSFTKGGSIHLSHTQDNPVTIINDTMQIADIDVSADSAGSVVIRGGQMVMNNANIWSQTTNGDGGGIDIGLAGDLTIKGVAEIPNVERTPQSGITSSTTGEGKAGNIRLNVDKLKLTHDTHVYSTSRSSGNGGDLFINTNSILLEGNPSKAVPKVLTDTQASGNAGIININANDELKINHGAFIRSFTTDNGDAGSITINTDSLEAHDKTQINIKTTESSTGDSGDLTINATNSINLNSDVFIDNQTSGKGQSGNLNLNTDSLKIDNSIINTSTSNSGDSGDLTITTNDLEVINKGIIRNSIDEEATGNSGNISIKATNSISLSGGGAIFNQTSGKGDSGNIMITSDKLDVRNNFSIFSNASSSGNAGDLFIDTNELKVINNGSIINGTDKKTTGNSGNISINATNSISLSDHGSISNTTWGKGDSGNIIMTSDKLDVRNGFSIFTGATSSGNGGDLFVDSNEIVLTNDEAVLFRSSDERPQTGIRTSLIEIGDNGNATGNSGNLSIIADHLIVSNGADISILNSGEGNSGDLLVNSDNILLTTSFDANTDRHILRGGIKINIAAENSKNTGNLTINSKNLVVENGTTINSGNSGSGTTGNILINSDNILLSGNRGEINTTGIINRNDSNGSLGTLTVNSKNLQIDNGAVISASTLGEGHGGDININSELITLSGEDSDIDSQSVFSVGDAGDIFITTTLLKMTDGAGISTGTAGFGLGGKIDVKAKTISLSGANTEISTRSLIPSSRNAGDLTINSQQLVVHDRAAISTTTNSLGVSSFLEVVAEHPQKFADIDLSTLPLDEYKNSFGNGGKLSITTDSLEIYEKGIISASTSSPGQGGELLINANDIVVNDSEIRAISVPEDVDIIGDSDISKSGNINLTVNNSLTLENNGSISVKTNKANAGEITIKGKNTLQLSNSEISTSVANAEGNGGNITIDSPLVSLSNSQIVAQAKRGKGGNITAPGILFLSPKSIVSASSELSTGGELNLKPDTNISGSIAVLPESLLNVSEQLNDRCNNRSGKSTNSFVVKGKGGIPLSPEKPVSSDFMDFLPTTDSPRNGLKNRSSHHANNNYQLSSLSVDCVLSSSAGKYFVRNE
jgi:filamentous hemagglutinin family protein